MGDTGVGKLFRSAEGMAGADNYNDWIFSLFVTLLQGDVLEVGCGVGTFTRRILDSGRAKQFLAIDVARPAIDHCRSLFRGAPVEFQCRDVATVSGGYDFVLCMNVLEHIADDRRVAEHLVGLLNPGGSLFLLVPSHMLLYSDFDRAAGHQRRYSLASVRALFSGYPTGQLRPLRQRYFNAIGALGYLTVYRILGKNGSDPALAEVGLFDRRVVPLLRRLEPSWIPFGLSVVTVVTRSGSRDRAT